MYLSDYHCVLYRYHRANSRTKVAPRPDQNSLPSDIGRARSPLARLIASYLAGEKHRELSHLTCTDKTDHFVQSQFPPRLDRDAEESSARHKAARSHQRFPKYQQLRTLVTSKQEKNLKTTKKSPYPIPRTLRNME